MKKILAYILAGLLLIPFGLLALVCVLGLVMEIAQEPTKDILIMAGLWIVVIGIIVGGVWGVTYLDNHK